VTSTTRAPVLRGALRESLVAPKASPVSRFRSDLPSGSSGSAPASSFPRPPVVADEGGKALTDANASLADLVAPDRHLNSLQRDHELEGMTESGRARRRAGRHRRSRAERDPEVEGLTIRCLIRDRSATGSDIG
jgi:hypothetical protein